MLFITNNGHVPRVYPKWFKFRDVNVAKMSWIIVRSHKKQIFTRLLILFTWLQQSISFFSGNTSFYSKPNNGPMILFPLVFHLTIFFFQQKCFFFRVIWNIVKEAIAHSFHCTEKKREKNTYTPSNEMACIWIMKRCRYCAQSKKKRA